MTISEKNKEPNFVENLRNAMENLDLVQIKNLLEKKQGMTEIKIDNKNLLVFFIKDVVVDLWFSAKLSDRLCIKKANSIIEYLSGSGISVNSKDQYNFPLLSLITPLIGLDEIAKKMIELGAEINFNAFESEKENLEANEKKIHAPIFDYIKERNKDMIRFLKNKGASLDVKNEDNMTPEEYAKVWGGIIEELQA